MPSRIKDPTSPIRHNKDRTHLWTALLGCLLLFLSVGAAWGSTITLDNGVARVIFEKTVPANGALWLNEIRTLATGAAITFDSAEPMWELRVRIDPRDPLNQECDFDIVPTYLPLTTLQSGPFMADKSLTTRCAQRQLHFHVTTTTLTHHTKGGVGGAARHGSRVVWVVLFAECLHRQPAPCNGRSGLAAPDGLFLLLFLRRPQP